jgi:hypothetical protein
MRIATSSLDLLIALMMEAASSCETSVNFYQNTRRSNPEDIRLGSKPTLLQLQSLPVLV